VGMSTSVVALRLRRRPRPLDLAQSRERLLQRRITWVWGLLFLNVLTFAHGTWNNQPLILPIPSVLGKLITQGALPVAFLLALTVNRRLAIRPNVFMCILSLLVIEAVVSGVHPIGHLTGTLFRTTRFAGFVATLWLLTPWWGRRDLLLVRCQLRALAIVLASILAGLLLSPSRALAEGRLSGEFWPTPPTQVADLAAVMIGMVVVLWFCGTMRGRSVLGVVLVAGTMLFLTHTRTEVIAMVAGLLIGGMSIFIAKARVRRLFVSTGVALAAGVTVFSGVVTTWLARGENSQELTSLTGRTSVWDAVLNSPRDPFQVVFGYGLSNKSFNGFPIDSNWLAAYYDLGLCGVVICVALVLFVLVAAYFQPRGPQRALALFLVTYLAITSLTETGLSDASAYLLELTLAASLLMSSRAEGRSP
jgi:hypothetical protein